MFRSATSRATTPRGPLPAAPRALLAQIIGWVCALLALRAGLLPGPVSLLAAQAVAAAATAVTLRSERWWIPIHLGFSPLLLAVHRLEVAPGWYLAVFLALVLVFWTSFRTRVPLYLSSRAAVAAVDALLPGQRPLRVLDLGSGTGALLVPLARARADCDFTGIETAPGPWLLSHLRAARLPNLRFSRDDFFRSSWSDYDVVYAFLSPAPMDAVWEKACAEMSAKSLFISNRFAVQGATPDREVPLNPNAMLYVYRPGAGAIEGN